MIVYPAIDMRHGRVVRLVYGDPSRETVYGDDPSGVAERWKSGGAQWLHVVNLDGALGEAMLALDTLKTLAKVGLPVQFGGGMRTLEDVQQALDAGAARVILGTMVVQQPQMGGEAVRRFGADTIAVALDAKKGKVATHGWQEVSDWSPANLGQLLARDGVRHVLYTDVSRDGDLSGVNVESTAQLAARTGLSVIASGGVASLEDIVALREVGNVSGVVIGKALYSKAFALEDAIQAAIGDN